MPDADKGRVKDIHSWRFGSASDTLPFHRPFGVVSTGDITLLRKFFFSSLFAFIAVSAVAMAPASAALPVPAPVHTEKIDDFKAVAPMSLRCEVRKPAAVVVNTATGEARSPDRTGKLIAAFAASYPNSRPLKVPWCR